MIDQAPTAIELQAVDFAYDTAPALRQISLRIPTGGIVGVIGPSGSGKTTLLRVMMGLLKPHSGQVQIAGRPIRDVRPAELYRTIGMVFQNPADQLFAPTVEQDVAFGPRNLGLSEQETASRVDEALHAVQAADLRSRPVHHLSFGEQRRVCVAGVLAMRPRIILLDEPTAGLDPAGEEHMIDLLLRLNREQGITLVISTHCVDLLPALTDRICILCKGELRREGTPREVFADIDAIEAMGLRLPRVAQLFRGLPVEPLPLTIDEGRSAIAEAIGRPV